MAKQINDNALINEYLYGNGKLSPQQKTKLKRCTECADLIRQYGSRSKVVPMLQTIFDIDQKSAYVLFEDTQIIFNTDKKDKKHFHIDILLGFIVETRNKAIAAKDFKSATAAEKNYLQLLKDFYGTEEKPDWVALTPPQVIVGFLPDSLNTPLPSTKDLEIQMRELLKVKKTNATQSFDEAQEVNDGE